MRPNVLIYVSHDTGRFISPYGYKTVRTPNLAALAEAGILFEDAFCTSPLCCPSRASIFTSTYPHETGVDGLTTSITGGFDLRVPERHAASLFRDAGYESVVCGPIHEAQNIWDLGFDRALGGVGKGQNYGGDLWTFGTQIEAWIRARDAGSPLPGVTPSGNAAASGITPSAGITPAGSTPPQDSPISNAKPATGPNGQTPVTNTRPFYLQIGSHETHRDWGKHDTPPDESRGVWMPPYVRDCAETRREMAAMQGAVNRYDKGVGDILAVLERTGHADDTVVVITTDHGIDMPNAKGTFRDPGLETLLLMRIPGQQGGVRIPGMVSNIDILPTILECCDLPVPDHCRGTSLLGRIEGSDGREEIFSEKTYHDSFDPTRSIRTGRFKYIKFFDVSVLKDNRLGSYRLSNLFNEDLHRRTLEELYDLLNDPDEMHNVSEEPTLADVKDELKRRLAHWMAETNDPLLEGRVTSPLYQRNVAEFSELANRPALSGE